MKRKLNYKKILIATGVLAVVATKSTKSEPKKELSSIITKLEVDGKKFNTEKTVLDEIIKQNKDVTANDVEIKNFKAASEGTAGSAELHAKADSKYTGKVNITITAKDKIALDSKITNKEVDGKKFNTEKTVLDEIIKQNKDVTANDVEIKNFKAASEGTAGSAELHAKADSKYTGKVNITITAKDKIALDSKITNKEVDGKKFNTEKTVLDEIIKQNKDVTANDVEIKNFKAASEGTAGSAELHAKADSKYTGKVNITITKIDTEEEKLEKIIKKIKTAADKERYGKEYVEAYKEYFAFLQKSIEAKFKIDPWIIDVKPTEINKEEIFTKLENYIRQIRISHYKIGLMEQGIYFHFKPEQMIITDNQELKLNNLWVFLHNYDENKHLPNSFFNINTTIKYQVK